MFIALAAENDPQDQVAGEAVAEPELVPAETESEPIQGAVEENDLILADVEEDTEAEEQTSRRFIPTEQISQDLGVSFPVDI